MSVTQIINKNTTSADYGKIDNSYLPNFAPASSGQKFKQGNVTLTQNLIQSDGDFDVPQIGVLTGSAFDGSKYSSTNLKFDFQINFNNVAVQFLPNADEGTQVIDPPDILCVQCFVDSQNTGNWNYPIDLQQTWQTDVAVCPILRLTKINNASLTSGTINTVATNTYIYSGVMSYVDIEPAGTNYTNDLRFNAIIIPPILPVATQAIIVDDIDTNVPLVVPAPPPIQQLTINDIYPQFNNPQNPSFDNISTLFFAPSYVSPFGPSYSSDAIPVVNGQYIAPSIVNCGTITYTMIVTPISAL